MNPSIFPATKRPIYYLPNSMKDFGDHLEGVNYVMQLFLIPIGALIDNDVKSRKGLGDLGYVWMTLEPLKDAPNEKEIKTET